ncbi:MAG: phage holin family protein [Deltaproteobacteria bacterium]|nr:phage holin family protein [Deltaproteobacteria bacterium]
MLALAGFLMLLGLTGVAVALIMLVVRSIFKRGWAKKRIWAVGAVSVALFVVGMVIGLSSVQDGYEAGRQAASNEEAVEVPSVHSPSVESEEAIQGEKRLPTPVKTTTDQEDAQASVNEQTDKESEQKPNIPELLQQDYEGIVRLLGEPTTEKAEKADERLVKYTLPGFELEITLFMDKPISIEVSPLKEYKFRDIAGYAISDVPDDVLQLLQDLGFSKDSVTGKSATPAQRLFSYVDYGSPLREYEIRVNSEDWRAVSKGKASKVSWVYIKLIKTK